MATVGAYEAKTHLPELLKRVESGEHITIARHGTPVAVLIPVGDYPRRDPAAAVAALREFSLGRRRGDFDIRAAIDEGRRY
jgi:prevent-host-death family protein